MTAFGVAANEPGTLYARIAALEAEKRALEDERRDTALRMVELERQNAHLSSLYVASYQLLGTLEREDVLLAIREIVINLIGSEEFAILERDPERGDLVLASAYGLPPERFARVAPGRGAIGRVAETGRPYFAADADPAASAPADPDETGLTACIPLKIEGRVTGVVAVFALLSHKTRFSVVDHELFDLLGAHAAMALYFASLHARVRHPTRPA